jgi:hypothetical protein
MRTIAEAVERARLPRGFPAEPSRIATRKRSLDRTIAARRLRFRPVGIEFDRRSSERVRHEIPALLVRELGDPDVQAARIRDLSDGGACAVSDVAFPVGTELYAGFFLEGFGGLPLIARVRVQWESREGEEHVVGLAFVGSGPAQRDSLERMRDYLAAMRRRLVAVPA